MLMSLTIFAGSVEFVAVNMLLGAFNPVQALAMTLMINARHLFYGISMLDKYKGTGWKKFYLIFGMCDESFSINYTADIPENIDKGWFMFFVTLLNHFYWFSGATLGGIFGSFIHFNTEGLDFVMTAMFVVIFMEQWLKEKKHTSAILGLGLSAFCLFVFGSDNFIIPSVFAVPCGKTDVEIYTISWKGFTVSCIWITCHLLFKRCKHICRKSWAAGIHCDNSSDCFALLETANASFHCRRNGMLYGTCTITFLSVY